MKKLKTLVLVGAVGAVVSAIAKKLQADGAGASTGWQSADPTPAPADVESAPEEELVDNAPAPVEEAGDAAEAVEPDLTDMTPPPPVPNHPEANEPLPAEPVDAPPTAPSAPDPLTDPLPEVSGEDEQQG